nr:immunoglobulin light chain junction region [Macaca mulatta]MOY05115.1 immunoglobulin light chain junction region [Macaca mulatta]MOY05279.1 immunoglobulin light chain junction region [Macaca mulatta]MOY05337.1 immunoglobulin light chain junction region [Macaca mulatta]MOY06009.1 immunoglobulin light chain junction region [Macaca mulatta]
DYYCLAWNYSLSPWVF